MISNSRWAGNEDGVVGAEDAEDEEEDLESEEDEEEADGAGAVHISKHNAIMNVDRPRRSTDTVLLMHYTHTTMIRQWGGDEDRPARLNRTAQRIARRTHRWPNCTATSIR